MEPHRSIEERRDDLIARLREGNVDVENFDRLCEKTLDELLEEEDKKEVTLKIIRDEDGKPLYVARIARTVAIRLVVPRLRLQYLEIMRTFSSGNTVHKRQPWTIKGTCRKGTTARAEAVRELREELGLT